MAYNTKRLLNKCIEVADKKKLFYITDVCHALAISTSTFYEHFPKESDEYKQVEDKLLENKLNLKVTMRQKWFASESAALQIGLMKLICTPEEREMLSQTYNKTELSGEITTTRRVDLSKLTDEQLDALENAVPPADDLGD